MASLGKVSFSFSKITKKPTLQQPTETVKKIDKIEFIDSIEDNSVKVINSGQSEENAPLIIPLSHPNLLLDNVIRTVKSRAKQDTNEAKQDIDENTEDSTGNSTKKKESLEEMAAREIMEDVSKTNVKKSEESTLTLPMVSNISNAQSSLDDYDNIPVSDFGLAMLRGMGWDPKKGIGKNCKIVKVTGPNLRPKGLGLGADKSITSQKPVGKNVSDKDVLRKGSKVRITFGNYKNLYGTIEGFDDSIGRIEVFMAISNEKVSMNECFVQLVTPEEFGKYSKVININSYNNYKEKESVQGLGSEVEEKDARSRIRTATEGELKRNGRSPSPIYEKNSAESNRSRSTTIAHSKHDKYSKRHSSTSESESSDGHNYKSSKSHSKYSATASHSKPDKYSKRHSSTSEPERSSDSHKYKSSKSHRKDSQRRHRDASSSSDSEYDRKVKNKKSKKKKERRSSSFSDYERRKKHKSKKKKESRSRSKR